MYTVVQHSAFTENDDPVFKKGLEPRAITNSEAIKIKEKGGVVFGGYMQADKFSMAEQYPKGYQSLIPIAPGSFVKVGNHKVYKPKGSK